MGREIDAVYQFHTVGSRENLIPFHLSLSRCHSPPQVVIATQALTASRRFLKGRKKVTKLCNECTWKETKMTYRLCTDVDWCRITHRCNKQNQSTLFILCHSRVLCGLVCKALLIPIVIVIITFSYAVEGQCKQNNAQFGFSYMLWRAVLMPSSSEFDVLFGGASRCRRYGHLLASRIDAWVFNVPAM